MIRLVLAVAVSYLIGSIPSGYIIGKYFKKVDIRKHGSGNTGATNALRIMGKLPGAAVLLLDIIKGLIAVTLLSNYLFDKTLLMDKTAFMYILGIAVIIGHDWTIFLRFKGGKGVAAALGVLVGLSFFLPEVKLIIIILLAIWILVFMIFRYVSLASISSAAVIPIAFFAFKMPANSVIFGLILGLLVIVRHKDNIKRLIKRQEAKISL